MQKKSINYIVKIFDMCERLQQTGPYQITNKPYRLDFASAMVYLEILSHGVQLSKSTKEHYISRE